MAVGGDRRTPWPRITKRKHYGFAFKTTPQNSNWADMLAVWREADDTAA
jgi:hypothetical protein